MKLVYMKGSDLVSRSPSEKSMGISRVFLYSNVVYSTLQVMKNPYIFERIRRMLSKM